MTSTDVLKINNSEELVGLIEDVVKDIPEINFFAASPVQKNSYKTLALTALPSTAFRATGSYREFQTATLTNKTVECKYLDASWILEKAVAQQSDWGEDFAKALTQRAHLKSEFFTLAKQIWQGTDSDANGFTGLDAIIDAVVDGRHIVVGQPEYMENQCFETVKESSDEECVGKTNRRILYLACDETIIAKFYIQYNTSPDFIYIVKHLYESGICVAISTIDPCIDNDILYKNRLDPERYAIKIIKGSEPEGTLERISSFDCGIASTGSLKGMVKTLMLCDRLSNLVKTNLAMKIVSAVLGAIIIGLVIGAGAMSSFTSVIPALYQLFWMIPMYLVSKVYIR